MTGPSLPGSLDANSSVAARESSLWIERAATVIAVLCFAALMFSLW